METDMVQAGIMGALITQRGDTVKQMWTSEWRMASNQNSVLILKEPERSEGVSKDGSRRVCGHGSRRRATRGSSP